MVVRRSIASLALTAVIGTSAPAQQPETLSLLGKPLVVPPIPADRRRTLEADLAAARAAYDKNPEDVDAAIWLGRRTAYLGRFGEAVEIYTRAIEHHAEEPRLYRHRGHRYITLRKFDLAIRDLRKAADLVEGKPDQVEPDGQPNARNMPIGTLHSNIAYHLGLAYYLRRDFARAIDVYRRELADARNDDRRVSTAHWLYMSLRRLGRDREAADVLNPITRQMNVIENETYHRLLLMYKGMLPTDSVLVVGPTGEMSVTDATAAYGVGNWHFYNGRRAEAERVFRRILLGGQWGAFGYITAEAELARMR